MPNPTVCPSCGARMRDSDATAGRPASCPACRAPVATYPPDDGGFEVIDSPQPPRARAKVVATRPANPARPASAKKPPRPPVEDDEDDEDDDRPRSRARSARSAEPRQVGRKPLLIGGGVVALLGLLAACGGGYWAFGESILHPAPQGWTTVSDSEGRYRLFMPGTATSYAERFRRIPNKPANMVPPQFPGHSTSDGGAALWASIESRPILAGASVPTDPEALVKLWSLSATPSDKREKLTAVRLGDRPGVEIFSFYNSRWTEDEPLGVFPVPEGLPAAEKKRREESNRQKVAEHAAGKAERDRKSAAVRGVARHKVSYLVASENRLYVIEISGRGAYPEESLLAILRNSFVIR